MLRRHLLTFATAGLFAGAAAARASQADPPSAIPTPYDEGPPPPPPGRRYVWEPGHWHWDGVGWEWHRGHYVIRRVGWTRYVPGQWVLRPRGWVWWPGHWV